MACAIVAALSVSVGAQLDTSGPVPRTEFDAKPDLSGVWHNVGRDDTEGKPEELTLNDVPFATFVDIGAGYRIGLPLHPWAAALKGSRRKVIRPNHPEDRCPPLGNQQFNAHSLPRRIVHAPGVIAIVSDTQQSARQIFTDGRPRRSDGRQFSNGYSRGAWQGDTLVVLTTNFRDGVWLDANGSPLTAAGRTIERLRRVSVGTLEVEQTVDDQKAYTRPFTTRLTWRLMPDTEGIDSVCRR